MSKKERYYYNGLGEDIYDSKIDDYPSNETICATLNQQDRRIKELEEENKRLFSLTQLKDCVFCEKMSIKYNQMLVEENQQLKEDLQAKDILINTYMSVVGTLDNAKKLKQSQNQKAIEVLEDILNYIFSAEGNHYPATYEIINCIKQKINQIKELRGVK